MRRNKGIGFYNIVRSKCLTKVCEPFAQSNIMHKYIAQYIAQIHAREASGKSINFRNKIEDLRYLLL